MNPKNYAFRYGLTHETLRGLAMNNEMWILLGRDQNKMDEFQKFIDSKLAYLEKKSLKYENE